MSALALATSVSSAVPSTSHAPRLTLTLEAVPNLDFPAGSHERTLRVPARQEVVGSLVEARDAVIDFCRRHKVGGGNYPTSAGRVERDGVPWCRVSYNGRLWRLDEKGRETFREMGLNGEVAP